VIVFLIDDDSEEAELFAEAIGRIGSSIELRYFDNGLEALKALKDAMPDLIFLDLNMPLLSGKETLKMLRDRKEYSKIPVVIYSTSISQKDADETQAFQVKRYLQKPENFNALCTSLNELLAS
jgi:CheY-like chemotaxis protein